MTTRPLATTVWLLASFCFCFATVPGCETTSDPVEDEIPEDTAPIPGTGTATGVVIVDDSRTAADVIDDPASVPAGWSAEVGADVHIRTNGGVPLQPETSAATDDGGRFVIYNIPPGSHVCRVTASGVPSLDVPFTAIADDTTALGRTYAVPRQDAIDIVLALPVTAGATAPSADALVLGTLQPLPPGVTIAPRGEDAPTPWHATIESETWFFVIDEFPDAAYSHSGLHYVLVDAATGAVTRANNALSTPVVNGAFMWSTDLDYIVYNGIDFSLDSYDISPAATADPTPEVVQVPDPPATGVAPTDTPTPASTLRGNFEDVFSLVVTCDERSDFIASGAKWIRWLRTQGVNMSQNHAAMLTPDYRVENEPTDWRINRRGRVFSAIEKRLEEGGSPTLFIYWNGHHTTRPDGSLRRAVGCKFREDQELFNTLGMFRILDSKACRVIVVLETCFAQAIAEDFLLEYDATPEDQRPELEIYAACTQDENTWGNSVFKSVFTLGLVDDGHQFTNAIIERASIVDGELVGLLNGSTLIPEMSELTLGFSGTQHPLYYTRPADPVWCRPPPALALDTESVSYVHTTGESPCQVQIGSVVLTNNTQEVLIWNVTGGDGALGGNPPGGVLNPGQSTTVGILFNCTAVSLNTEMVFTATNQDNTRQETAALPVNVQMQGSAAPSIEFDVRPAGAMGTRKWQIWHPVPLGATIDSTKLVDTATGEAPPLQPWLPMSPQAVNQTFEGWRPDGDAYYGTILEIDNLFGSGCPECATLRWRYTVWWSVGGEQRASNAVLAPSVVREFVNGRVAENAVAR